MITPTSNPSPNAIRSVEKSAARPPHPGLRQVSACLSFAVIALLALPAGAANRYVDQNNATPAWPHDSWANAAVHVQEAVDAAADNDTVWIRAGTYTLPPNPTNYWGDNVVYFSRPLTLRSETGNPDDVIIDGEGTNRPIAVVNTAGGSSTIITDPFVIRGITVTNGFAVHRGGGILFYASLAAWPAHVVDCVVTSNTVVYGDSATAGGNLGDGAYGGGICAYGTGSGLYLGGEPAGRSVVRNSLFHDNLSKHYGSAIGLLYQKNTNAPLPLVANCTIVNNKSSFGNGAIGVRFAYLDTGAGMALINSIVWNNIGNDIVFDISSEPVAEVIAKSALTNNITTALQSSVPFPGTGNITAAPTFVDAGADDFRLVRDSRGVNEGFNLAAALQGATDLDGNRRIDSTFGTVDIGCYEYTYRGALLLVR